MFRKMCRTTNTVLHHLYVKKIIPKTRNDTNDREYCSEFVILVVSKMELSQRPMDIAHIPSTLGLIFWVGERVSASDIMLSQCD